MKELIKNEINLTKKKKGKWIAWYCGKRIAKDINLIQLQIKINKFIKKENKIQQISNLLIALDDIMINIKDIEDLIDINDEKDISSSDHICKLIKQAESKIGRIPWRLKQLKVDLGI